jgi:DNA-binding NarL/FixJ family response regulator
MAEGGETGIGTLQESLSVLEASSAKLERARTLVELGSALRRENERKQAREVLRRGLDLAVRSGSQPLVDQAQRELAATGAKSDKPVLTGVESLTPSERQVAELAVGALTDKDIAQALFVSTKSVEDQLASVYRKLGVASRAELAETLDVAATSA